MAYSSAVFNNCGNFKSFGDSKFIPELSEDEFNKILKSSSNYLTNQNIFDELYAAIRINIFEYKG